MSPGHTRYAPVSGTTRWLLVAGRRFVAAVESTVADAIVDTVWWLADSELATIESVVGAFPLTGPDAVRSFAVAELSEPDARGEVVVTAVVRGSAAIDIFSVGGSRRFSGAGVQPWVLAEFRAVTGLIVGGDDAPTGPVAQMSGGSLPIGLGIVEGELLTWSLSPIARVERGAVEPAPRRDQVESGAGAGADAAAADPEETIIRPRAGASLFVHPDRAAQDARRSADGADAHPFAGAEVPPAGNASPVAHELPGAVDIEPPTATPAGDDGPGSMRHPATDEFFPATEPVVLPPAPARFAVRFPTGDSYLLDAPLLIGRRPTALRVASGREPRLVSVPSPDQEVSATHVRIEQEGDAVVVTDLRSTNGTVLTIAGERVRLRPGQSQVVLTGTAVDIGDGNIIEITAATAAL